MNIQVLDTAILVTEFATYDTVILECEKVKCRITRAAGQYSYINVVVLNAVHRAFRGMGKDFQTIEEALNHYKSPKMKAMLQFNLS
jgi:hypothetical protein